MTPPLTLLEAGFAGGGRAAAAFDRWAVTFDPTGDVDPGDFAVLPAVYAALFRTGKADATDTDLNVPASTGDRTSLAPAPVVARLRGIARRAWSGNQLRLRQLRTVTEAMNRARITAVVAPGPLTTVAERSDSAAEIGVVELLVVPSLAARATAVLLALGGVPDQDPVHALNGAVDWIPGFVAVLDGVMIHLNWAHGADVGEPSALSPLAFGAVAACTLPPGARVWFNLDRALRAEHTGTKAAAMVDLLSWAELWLQRPENGIDQVIAAVLAQTPVGPGWDTSSRRSAAELLAELSTVGPDATRHLFIALAEAVSSPGIPSGAPGSAEGTSSVRSGPPRRALEVVRNYRSHCRHSSVPMTARGFYRYLMGRWGVRGLRSMTAAAWHRASAERRNIPLSSESPGGSRPTRRDVA